MLSFPGDFKFFIDFRSDLSTSLLLSSPVAGVARILGVVELFTLLFSYSLVLSLLVLSSTHVPILFLLFFIDSANF